MTIVVTGATGHLGALAIDHLLARGVPAADIVAGGRDPDRLARLGRSGVRTAVLDYDAPATIADAVAGADAVVLVSGSEVGTRVRQHGAVVDAAKAAGVGRLVYTSAPRARESALILAPDHKATEELIEASGLPATILRNNWYNENYVAALEQAARTGAHVASTDGGRVASAARTDYAEAIAAVLTSPGHEGAVYELSGDTAWDGEEFARVASEVLGRQVVYRPVSSDEHLAILREAGVDDDTAAFVVALDANIRDGLLAETSGELARLIGHATTPLVETLRAAAAAGR